MGVLKGCNSKIVFFSNNTITMKELYELFFIPLCSYSNKYVKNHDVSGDIVQEVFIKIWEKRKDFRSIQALRTFIYIATRNASFNYLRDFDKVCLIDEQLDERSLESQSLIIEEEAYRLILKEVNSLPESCKKVFNLTLQDMSISEISECLHISKHTVRNQRAKAREILKSRVGDWCYTLLF